MMFPVTDAGVEALLADEGEDRGDVVAGVGASGDQADASSVEVEVVHIVDRS
jgi:hypothetical protein